MARRHERLKELNEQLTRAQLKELEKQLLAEERWKVEIRYKSCHNAASYRFNLPSPALMQELVTIWRVLRKWGAQPKQLDRNG